MAEITLQSPVQRKDETIDQIHLRRPAAGELRGLSLAQLMQMNVDAILKLVPRITTS
ncbi:MAG: phage tail assembly protein, partial [Rhodovulum sp.]